MKTILCALAIVACGAYSSALAADGYCMVNGTTTGGGNGATTTVTTASAFKTAVSGSTYPVVIVQGAISDIGSVSVASSKTIQGACTGGSVTGQLTITKSVSNIIVSNLTMVGDHVTSTHCIDILSGAHHVFVSHCNLSDAIDECLSVTKNADYVTASWCHFSFVTNGTHTFPHLIGSADGYSGDDTTLHVTFHHNWYGTNCTQRMPRVRAGHVHVYDNYYKVGEGDSYCVGVGYQCRLRVENNYFDSVNSPWDDYANGAWYDFGYTNNVFGDHPPLTNFCNGTCVASNSMATIFSPPYTYSNNLDIAETVKDLVMAGAGPSPGCGPVALFSGSPITGAAPLSVTFADYSTGDITNRFWSFGDGSTGNTTAGTTNHTYAAGSNTVSLTVYASSGSNTFTRTNFIIVAGGGGVPPSITQQPLSTNVCAGSTATFSVTATGDAPLFYQWQTNSINLVNGGEFSGATSTVLTVSSASATDAATYRCIVTNAAGSDTSSNATLTVNALPTQYTVGGGGSYCSGGSGVAVTLSSSQLGVTYYLQLGGSNTGATQAGTGSGLNFTGVTAAGTYGILASNTVTGCTATMSGGATVSLTDPFQCWQLQYFGCTNCPQAAADADPLGKGMSNTNQLLAGLNPTNPASVFRITSVVADSSSNVMITWSTAGVRTNAVQAASVGVSGDYDTNFVDITTSPHIIIPATGDFTTNYLDAGGATNTPSRFYRIRLVP